jgi:gamma-glutamyl:cysteine ligase YbdK (ATP-grasp superfamily)
LGIEIQQEHFAPADYARFKECLQENLAALERVLARPEFGRGQTTLGVELELFLIDRDGRPLAVSEEVVQASASPLVTPEMGAFDIELSTAPVALAGRPFSTLRANMAAPLQLIRQRARAQGARVVPVSILPTFRRTDFHCGTITDRPRYRALAAGLRRLRAAPFHICIDGDDPLELMSDDVAMEAANTAFQVHLRAAPEEFARLFNAAIMLTAPVLAAAGNSPTFLGHRLWEETRVALFKQAGDDRPPDRGSDWRKPPRIGFGTGWVRDGALELFAESVAMHEPILPVCDDEDALACVEDGGVPRLGELRLHQGTVWNWNRPVYDPAGAGHLRIELRALPAGPSLDDMLANASFLVGGILSLAPEISDLLPSFPFALAERNFYRAAQYGLDAELVWPVKAGTAPRAMRARELLEMLAPRVRAGLLDAGVEQDEVDFFVGLFGQRVESGVTGAQWQRRTLSALRARGATPEHSLRAMLEQYVAHVDSGLPVHRWRLLEG